MKHPIAIACFVLILLYPCSYLALVQKKWLPWTDHNNARYRVGGGFAQWLFTPTNTIDRFVRSDYWKIVDYSNPDLE